LNGPGDAVRAVAGALTGVAAEPRRLGPPLRTRTSRPPRWPGGTASAPRRP